ncbi:MAG: diguanylate cyclase [Desulfuromonadales bacterium C00003094]|nr:MAG: diguanylate cyclase [Desulfuromonadales bacterium C00003094]OEU73858.1 MAG: diguanylate cyclase [Desulfuromonadales bacterium C00003107]
MPQPDYLQLLDHLYDGLYFVDPQRKITFWNRTAEQITGFTAEEVIGSHCYDNILNHVDAEGNSLCENGCPLSKAMEADTNIESEVYLRHKDGHRVPVAVRIRPLPGADGQVMGGIELFQDLSEKTGVLLQLEELRQLALVDGLTGLANRNYFEREIEAHLQEQARYGWPFGLLFVDIDNFKQINDTYGHEVGDRVLQMVARNLKHICRPFDVFGRWGGEEFIGLVRNIQGPEMKSIAERLRMLIENSQLQHGDGFVGVTVSVGATLARVGDTLSCLVRRADELMYRSKNKGKNCLTTDF